LGQSLVHLSPQPSPSDHKSLFDGSTTVPNTSLHLPPLYQQPPTAEDRCRRRFPARGPRLTDEGALGLLPVRPRYICALSVPFSPSLLTKYLELPCPAPRHRILNASRATQLPKQSYGIRFLRNTVSGSNARQWSTMRRTSPSAPIWYAGAPDKCTALLSFADFPLVIVLYQQISLIGSLLFFFDAFSSKREEDHLAGFVHARRQQDLVACADRRTRYTLIPTNLHRNLAHSSQGAHIHT
jgi:hypothetical protein